MLLDAMFGGELKLLPRHGTLLPSTAGGATSGPVAARRSTLSLLSWNLLAPPYKRPAEAPAASAARAVEQIQVARTSEADVIGLQEFWLDDAHQLKWRDFAASAGYSLSLIHI